MGRGEALGRGGQLGTGAHLCAGDMYKTHGLTRDARRSHPALTQMHTDRKHPSAHDQARGCAWNSRTDLEGAKAYLECVYG